MYANTKEKCYDFFKTDKVVSVEPCYDVEYLKSIDIIKANSKLLVRGNVRDTVREIYETYLNDGRLRIMLFLKGDDYYDITEYQFMSNTAKMYPITWTMNDPETVANLFFTEPLKYIRYSYRRYGQPKLSKPKELKGIKQSFSTPFKFNSHGQIRATCGCFVVGDDLWIKHSDYFSSSFTPPREDFDKPTGYLLNKYFNTKRPSLKKFAYPDCWGDIILRDEAWLHIQNFKQIVGRDRCNSAAKTLYDEMIKQDAVARICLSREGGEYITEWEHFWERLVQDYKKYINS